MMQFYVCKRPGLYGVPVGHVERYARARGASLAADGFLEEFDPKSKSHRQAPGANAALEHFEALAAETKPRA